MPYAVNCKKKELTGLLEVQIVDNLDSGYLLGIKCSTCEKVIANKIKLTNEEKAT